MLIEYISKAMMKAVYEKLEDDTYSGKIPQCPGVIAFGETLYKCQEELRSVLEGWLIVKIRHGDKLPVIGGINLNNKMPVFKEMVAHTLPNNAEYSIPQIKMLLKEIELGIKKKVSLEEWQKL